MCDSVSMMLASQGFRAFRQKGVFGLSDCWLAPLLGLSDILFLGT